MEENGQNVVKMTEYAAELADYLVKYHKNDFFHFFCGNIRSDEIPSKLKENNIAFEEIEVYKTTLNPKKFERQFDAILFFSPSGVRSYCEERSNLTNDEATFVCIGTTTASEAKKIYRKRGNCKCHNRGKCNCQSCENIKITRPQRFYKLLGS